MTFTLPIVTEPEGSRKRAEADHYIHIAVPLTHALR